MATQRPAVTSWASSLDKKQPERKYAEELYDDIVLDRAYGERRGGKLDESRGYFYGATVATDSLEAHVGFIEARILEGGADAQKNLDQVYEKRFARDPDSPVYAFVKAYRIARELPHEKDTGALEKGIARVIELLAADPTRRALAGDQLFVDLDITEANLPPGTRLAIGTSVIEVTEQPHTGCQKFSGRFGVDALRWVNDHPELRLRGLCARVVLAGTVRPGDTVRKVT